MIHLTSDLHMFHDRAFIYEPRDFKSVQAMMDYYRQEWLGNVAKQDDIYIVGDFCLGTDYDAIEQLVKSLPGNKHLLIGNHDTDAKVDFYKSLGMDVKYADVIEYKKRRFYLSHFITHVASLESNPDTCLINLHGHLHTKEKFHEDIPYLYNVSMDANNNKIITLDDVLDAFQAKVSECIELLK